MKVLLINPPIRVTEKASIFPSGLGYIAAIVQKENHEVKVLDLNIHRLTEKEVINKLKKYLLEEKIEIVGIGCLITCYDYVKDLVKKIREIKFKTKIVIGGGLGTSIPEMVLEKIGADIAVVGEGEKTMEELMQFFENKKKINSIKGVYYKKGGKIIQNPARERIENLDEVPFPAWHLFPIQEYVKNDFNLDKLERKNKRSMNIITGKGCPYHCIYCYDVFGHKKRIRSVKNIIKEIKLLKQLYGVDFILITDDLFTINREFVYDFCNSLLKEKLNISWGCSARVNLVDESLLKKMKNAGCKIISYGIESGSQKMLDIMRKGITVEQASKAINLTRKTGIIASVSFMMGFPEETKEDLEKTIKFCIDNDIYLTSMFLVTPYPGTVLYNQIIQKGLIKDVEKYVSKLGNATELTINLTKLSDKELFKLRTYVLHKIQKAYFKKHRIEQIKWYFKKINWLFENIKRDGLNAIIKKGLMKIKK